MDRSKSERKIVADIFGKFFQKILVSFSVSLFRTAGKLSSEKKNPRKRKKKEKHKSV